MATPIIALDVPAETFDQSIDRAAQFGYESIAIQLHPVESAGAALSVEASESDCVELAKRALAKGVSIAALILPGASALEWLSPPRIDPGGQIHQAGQTFGRISAVLQRAAWLDARQVVLPAVGPTGLGTSVPTSDDAIRAALESLANARFEAQRRAIEVVVMVSPCGVCHSPTEARWFFDQVNSPWIGAGIEADEATGAAAAEHLGALAHRARVLIWRGSAISGEVGSLLKALIDARFDGTLLVRSPAKPPARTEWDTHFAQVI